MSDDEIDDKEKTSTHKKLEGSEKGNGPTGRKKITWDAGDDADGFIKLYTWITNALGQIDTTRESGELFLSLLAEEPEVIRCLLVSHDGTVMAAESCSGTDAESMAHSALGGFMSTEMVIKKLGQNRIHSIVNQTPDGYLILVDIGPALLVLWTTEKFDYIAGVMF